MEGGGDRTREIGVKEQEEFFYLLLCKVSEIQCKKLNNFFKGERLFAD
jgi:hypothetical protein